MKKIYLVLCLLSWTVLGGTGCGVKGDPLVPVIPRPLPVQEVSASLSEGGITLAWTLPSKYDTGKSLELKDVKMLTVFRKTDTPVDNHWEFSQNNEGWTVAGGSSPIKRDKGVLRTASQQKNLLLLSPKGLALKAEDARYLRLRLWTKNSDRAELAFITKADSKWDIDQDLTFYPAAYTSFYAYQNAFNAVKLKSFPILPEQTGSGGARAYDYLLDMKDVAAWQGEIDQIGVMLHNREPENALVEVGLDSFEVMGALEPKASVYESPPWVFLEDAEGWQANSAATVFGAAGGVLYARGSAAILLASSPGQNLALDRIRQVQIRMQVTTGDRAYLVLRRTEDQPFPLLSEDVTELAATRTVPFLLNAQAEFQTYTIDLAALTPKGEPDASQKKGAISQVALFFPATTTPGERQILIDYVHVLDAPAEPTLLASLLPQKDIPASAEIAQQVQQKTSLNAPDYEVAYDELPAEKEQDITKPIKLAEILPKDPAPAVLQDGKFTLTDTGQFAVGEDAQKDLALHYDERYTYTIELLDRKAQKSAQVGSVTIGLTRTPTAPYNLQAQPGDQKIDLTWQRPFLTVDGKKVKTLSGYAIFRSLEAGRYPKTPLAQVSAADTTFTDNHLTNGTTYYYTVEAATATTSKAAGRNFSSEASAVPVKQTLLPEAPTGLVGVYNGNVVNLFWNLTQAKNFAGFNLYRSENPAGEFQRLNAQPILQASAQDPGVAANKIYYYYVTAFDAEVPPNESRPSEIAVVDTATFE